MNRHEISRPYRGIWSREASFERKDSLVKHILAEERGGGGGSVITYIYIYMFYSDERSEVLVSESEY